MMVRQEAQSAPPGTKMASPDVSTYATLQKSTVRTWQLGNSRRRRSSRRRRGEESIVIRPESRTWHSVPRSSHTTGRHRPTIQFSFFAKGKSQVFTCDDRKGIALVGQDVPTEPRAPASGPCTAVSHLDADSLLPLKKQPAVARNVSEMVLNLSLCTLVPGFGRRFDCCRSAPNPHTIPTLCLAAHQTRG